MNPFKIFMKKRIGLALGSGGAKGIAHVAVIDYLEQQGIPIDMIAGSSIGAVVGAIYCTGNLQRFKKDIAIMTKREMLPLIDPIFPRSGFVEGNRFVDFIKEYIPEDVKIEDLDIPLTVLATEYHTGSSIVFRKGNLLEAVRASVSIPGILVPMRYRSTLLIDGGVANPLPINVVKNMGANVTIAVNLHPRVSKKRFRSFMKNEMHSYSLVMDADSIEKVEAGEKMSTTEKEVKKNWRETVSHWLKTEKPKKEKMPSVLDIISRTIDIMEFVNTMLMLKYNTPTVLIEPDLLHIGTLDFDESGEILKEGYDACEKVKWTIKRRVKGWI